jgi:deoxyribodipyrimidine photolyase-related protein
MPSKKVASTPTPKKNSIRHALLVLGDQLDAESAIWNDFENAQDIVLMAEVAGESTHVWSSKARTAFFLSAMRHFAETLVKRGIRVIYLKLGSHQFQSLSDALADTITTHHPQKVVMVEPGDWRVEQEIRACCVKAGVQLAMREDTHFLISRHEFATWARGYKQLRMEFFYRMMRKRHDVMMESGEPLGGRWNYDAENRGAFGKSGPVDVPAPTAFAPDAITREVFAAVETHLPDHPGCLAEFSWAVTRKQALAALDAFIRERLPRFGEYQDAMWQGEPYLYHSLVSACLNVKLLNPREVIAAAIKAHADGTASIESVEGFVRQILGWREFIRGVYWFDMPAMRDANKYGHTRPLPRWYWTADTNMNCMRHTIGQTLQHGYAHHIQRLMVTGIFGLLAEIKPQEVEDWYLAVYIDAVEWAELPNVAGMALYANDGRFTSKPYIASGAYIKRMSNYCGGCRYRPDTKTGTTACPFTTLYWHFLDKHERALAANPRTSLMVRNVARLSAEERAAIRAQATKTLENLDTL